MPSRRTHVQVLEVQAQQFLSASPCFVGHPPQQPVPASDVRQPPQLLEYHRGQGAFPAFVFGAPADLAGLGRGRRVGGGPASLLDPPEERQQRGAVPVERGRGGAAPPPGQ